MKPPRRIGAGGTHRRPPVSPLFFLVPFGTLLVWIGFMLFFVPTTDSATVQIRFPLGLGTVQGTGVGLVVICLGTVVVLLSALLHQKK